MKNKVRNVMVALCLIAAAGSFGCAGDRYERSTGEYIDDKAIGTKVKKELVADKQVSALDVKVDTYRGVVQLSGFVDTPEQKNRAGEVARSVQGVREVQYNIIVK